MISKKLILKSFLYAITVVVILLASMSIYFLTERNEIVALPKPTGSFAVGRTSYNWTDPSRNKTFTEANGGKRKLTV